MPYTIEQIECDGEHQWAVLSCSCNLLDINDLLILETVALIRSSYAEDAVIARALTSMVRLLQSLSNEMLRRAVLRMLEGLGRDHLPNMYISPAIVRGTTISNIDDLQPIREAVADYAPAISCGVSVSIGVALEEFGRIVMQKARDAA